MSSRVIRPNPAQCLHGCGRVARPNKQYPHLATFYCSDACKANNKRICEDDEARQYANAIRMFLGMPDDRCRSFSLPELRTMHRRIERLLPYGALAKTTKPRRRRSA